MSVIHKKSNGGASTEIEKEVREVKAAGEQTAALLALSFKAQIVQDRAAGTNVISDAAILQSAEVIEYDEYADNHAYNTVGENHQAQRAVLRDQSGAHVERGGLSR